MGWFKTVKNPKLKVSKKVGSSNTPSGFWKKCTACGETVQNSKLEESVEVCPYCDHHFRLFAKNRVSLLIDDGTFEVSPDSFQSNNPLDFKDRIGYEERLKSASEKTGLLEGTITGVGLVDGKKVSLAVMNFQFMGGSMGVATGEKISNVFDRAYQEKIPAIIVSSSGGARMQEGILSLMQMAKTSGARGRLKNAGIPYISILTDPTTGGVAASFAMLGDINIAEPGALIGFAGPRVIEQSIRQVLPDGFQRSEFLHEHGFIDRIVHRHKMKSELSFFLNMFS